MSSRAPGGTVLLVVLSALLSAGLAVAQVGLWRDWNRTTGDCRVGCFPGGMHGLAVLWAIGTLLTLGLAIWAFRARPGAHGVRLLLAAVLLLVVVPLDPFPVLGEWVVLSSWRTEPLARLVLAGACCVVAAALLAWESVRLRRTVGARRIATYDELPPVVSRRQTPPRPVPGGRRSAGRPPPPGSRRRSPAASPQRPPLRR